MRIYGLLLLVAFVAGACSAREFVDAHADTATGQKLVDLQQAHANGLVSPSEYERQRRRLMASLD